MKYFYILLLSILAFNTQAKVHSSDSNFWYVDNFYQYSKNADNLLQTNTDKNNSCGLTSVLFVNNYFSVKNTGLSPSFIDSVTQATTAINRLYDYLGISNDSTTEVNDARTIAKYRWNWSDVARASGSNSMDYNLSLIAEK